MSIRGVTTVSALALVFLAAGGARADWSRQNASTEAAPTFFDLDGDGRKEILASTFGGIFVYHVDGSIVAGWPPFGDAFGSGNAVGVADVDRDGLPDVVVSELSFPSKVHVLDATGHEKPGWPVPLTAAPGGAISAPCLIDLDGDGFLEVAVTLPNGVFVLRHDGTPQPGWPYLWSAALPYVGAVSGMAAADVDHDGIPELVAQRSDSTEPQLFVLKADGQVAPGWPKATEYSISAPAVADLDGDGRMEIVMREGDAGSPGSFVRVFRHDGTSFPGWPRPLTDGSRSSPAIADLDGDGRLEIIVAGSSGILYVFQRDGQAFHGFPFDFGGGTVISSPSVADVDGDGSKEIFLQYNPRSSPSTQVVSGWKLNGSTLAGFPKTLVANTMYATAASIDIADADGDGHYELVVGAQQTGSGMTWFVTIPSSTASPGAFVNAWPRIHHDATNRSVLDSAAASCDDGNPCTADSGSPPACVHTPLTGGACDDGDTCTINDTCSGGVCVGTGTANDPKPKTSGYYKKLCKGPYKGDALTQEDVECVNDVPNFSAVATIDDLCFFLDGKRDKTNDSEHDSECRKAEKELTALALNRCRARVCDGGSIQSECGDRANTTVGESFVEASMLILDVDARTKAMCKVSGCLSQEINGGHAFRIDRAKADRSQHAGIVLRWEEPYLADGTVHPAKYEIYRQAIDDPDGVFTKIGETRELTFTDDTPGDFEYSIEAVAPGSQPARSE